MEVVELSHMNLEDVVALGRDMHWASTFREMTYSAGELAQFLGRMVSEPHLQGFLARKDGQLVGFILCGLSKSFFGPDLVAGEFALYVAPEARGAGVAKQLVQSYVDWALANGARRVNVGNSAGTPDEAYVSLMEKEGFTRTGSQLYLTV